MDQIEIVAVGREDRTADLPCRQEDKGVEHERQPVGWSQALRAHKGADDDARLDIGRSAGRQSAIRADFIQDVAQHAMRPWRCRVGRVQPAKRVVKLGNTDATMEEA